MTGASDKPGALLLDEMFSPVIAADLAARGIDCRAVVADPLLCALSDLEIFETALLEGWVVVTNNVPDFESLRRAREAAGGEIPGLIYPSDLAFPRTKAACRGSRQPWSAPRPATRRPGTAVSCGCVPRRDRIEF